MHYAAGAVVAFTRHDRGGAEPRALTYHGSKRTTAATYDAGRDVLGLVRLVDIVAGWLQAGVREDEARGQQGGMRRMRWLTVAQHVNRTSYSCMKVNLAVAVLKPETADQLQLRRLGGWR